MHGARCSSREVADLLKRQLAPQVGNHRLPQLDWQLHETPGDFLAVELLLDVLKEPVVTRQGVRFITILTADGRSHLADRKIPHDTKQPRPRIVRRGILPPEFEERVLHDVCWLTRPLARIKLQGRQDLLDQSGEFLVGHATVGCRIVKVHSRSSL